MRGTTRKLVLMHSDSTLRERVRRLAHGRWELRWVAGWACLPDALREIGPAGIAVLDPYHAQPPRGGISPELGALLRRFPSATVVAALRERPGWLADIRTLGEWGIAAVLDLDAETTDLATLQRITNVRGRPLRALLDRDLNIPLSGRGRAILDAAAEVAVSGGHARDLAKGLHLHRDTLLRWCRQAELPVPRRLLMWMRILLAAELLDNPGQTAESVAFACGYSSDDALARALGQQLGMRPGVLRERGAFRLASTRFRDELRELRSEPKGSGTLQVA